MAIVKLPQAAQQAAVWVGAHCYTPQRGEPGKEIAEIR